jgi:uncharacterized Zn-finger protein
MKNAIHCCNKGFTEVEPQQLPLYCPQPEMSRWNGHPRVFLKIEETGEARCPYCGTLYVLKGGPLKKAAGH